jgi:transketolase C-terminal domain/subunit
MSYATLLVYVNVDHASKQLVSVAAGLADKFSAKLIGLSALAIMPPFAADRARSQIRRRLARPR